MPSTKFYGNQYPHTVNQAVLEKARRRERRTRILSNTAMFLLVVAFFIITTINLS